MMEPLTIEQIAAELTNGMMRAKGITREDQPVTASVWDSENRIAADRLADRLDLLVHLSAINGQRAAAASIAERTLQHPAAQAGKDAEVYAAIQGGDITGLYESLGVKADQPEPRRGTCEYCNNDCGNCVCHYGAHDEESE